MLGRFPHQHSEQRTILYRSHFESSFHGTWAKSQRMESALITREELTVVARRKGGTGMSWNSWNRASV
jgi:hypothetical protein